MGVAWALEQTKYFTLRCIELLVVVDHGPACEILGDKAMEDITNARIFQFKEKTLPWIFSIAYRPSKTNHVAGWMARNPVETPGEDERDVHDQNNALRSEISAVPRNRMHPLVSITFDLVAWVSKNDETIQKVMSQLTNGLPDNESEACTEFKEWWQYRE